MDFEERLKVNEKHRVDGLSQVPQVYEEMEKGEMVGRLY